MSHKMRLGNAIETHMDNLKKLYAEMEDTQKETAVTRASRPRDLLPDVRLA